MAFMLLFLWQYICIAVEFEGSCMCEKDFSKGFFFFPEKFLWLPKGIRSYFPLIVVLESIPQLGISVPVLQVLKERDIKKKQLWVHKMTLITHLCYEGAKGDGI